MDKNEELEKAIKTPKFQEELRKLSSPVTVEHGKTELLEELVIQANFQSTDFVCVHCGVAWEDSLSKMTCPCLDRY